MDQLELGCRLGKFAEEAVALEAVAVATVAVVAAAAAAVVVVKMAVCLHSVVLFEPIVQWHYLNPAIVH
jgi:hypothetical protein